jgi:4-hydroxy-3-methylbut-2-enyl diphosphate reductase
MLKGEGLRPVDEIGGLEPGILVIRSHGAAPAVFEAAAAAGMEIVDATCPLVGRAQDTAMGLKNEGYFVVVAGHPSHPEVEGIVGRLGEGCLAAEDAGGLAGLPPLKKIGVVAQTTASNDTFTGVCKALLGRAGEVRIFDTLCSATVERQEAARKLAGEVDVMVVAGGRNSSNTCRLAEACLQVNPRTHHVESAAELKDEWFAGARRVGLTGGASTPEWVLEEVWSSVVSG